MVIEKIDILLMLHVGVCILQYKLYTSPNTLQKTQN